MRDDRKLISQIIKLEDDIGILQRAYAVTNDSWKQQQSELQEYHELTLAQTAKIRELKAELAQLRKVADAAREFVGCPCEDDGTAECAECTACNYRQALAELDEESER